MGVNDRRFFPCPALIPYILEKVVFAGTFFPSIPQCAAPSRARILLRRDNRGSEHFGRPGLGAPRWPPPNQLLQAILEGPAERFL
jgi:hypothetical protein